VDVFPPVKPYPESEAVEQGGWMKPGAPRPPPMWRLMAPSLTWLVFKRDVLAPLPTTTLLPELAPACPGPAGRPD